MDLKRGARNLAARRTRSHQPAGALAVAQLKNEARRHDRPPPGTLQRLGFSNVEIASNWEWGACESGSLRPLPPGVDASTCNAFRTTVRRDRWSSSSPPYEHRRV